MSFPPSAPLGLNIGLKVLTHIHNWLLSKSSSRLNASFVQKSFSLFQMTFSCFVLSVMTPWKQCPLWNEQLLYALGMNFKLTYSIVYYNRFRTLSYKKKKKKTGCIYTKSKGEICCFIYYWMPSNGSCKLPTDLTKDFFLFSTGEDWEEVNLVLIVKIVKGTR